MRPTGVTLIAVYDYLAGAFLGLVGRPVRWRQSHQHAGGINEVLLPRTGFLIGVIGAPYSWPSLSCMS